MDSVDSLLVGISVRASVMKQPSVELICKVSVVARRNVPCGSNPRGASLPERLITVGVCSVSQRVG